MSPTLAPEPGHDLTRLLARVGRGDPDAESALLPLVYGELRRLARARMAHARPGTLQPTALVHEAWLRLAGKELPPWEDRGHFFATAARAMRDILVEHARRKASAKRGGDHAHEAIDDVPWTGSPSPADLLALDQALTRLRALSPRKADVVQLRFFAGLSMEEIARSLGLSLPTVEREWRFARAILGSAIEGAAAGHDA